MSANWPTECTALISMDQDADLILASAFTQQFRCLGYGCLNTLNSSCIKLAVILITEGEHR